MSYFGTKNIMLVGLKGEGMVVNALVGSASGTAVILPDVSPIEHDLKVRVSSVNLATNITADDNAKFENGVATQTKADTYTTIYLKVQIYQDNAYVSGGVASVLTSTGKQSYTFTRPKDGNKLVYGINGQVLDTVVSIDITDLPEGVYTISANFTNITQGSISWRDIQLEKGSTATEYKPPVSDLLAVKLLAEGQDGIPVKYTVNADGTVGGVKAIAPFTTLTTDTDGVLIECEYNKDANAVVANFENRLAALEAAVISQ